LRSGDELMRKTDAVSGDTVAQPGDVIEFTSNGERRTAKTMLVSDAAALDPIDGNRPAWALCSLLEDIAVFRLDPDVPLVAARPRGRTA
jgi:hypothetical protein